MRDISELIKRARELKKRGLTTGEIADELNVSRETALWLVTHTEEERAAAPRDIYIDWRNVGSNPVVLRHVALAMAELIREILEENSLPEPEVIAGIAVSGVPLATIIAEELNAKLCIIRPKKHMWEPQREAKQGFILSNFARVEGKKVVIVDDIATTGTTLSDTIAFLTEKGATPLAAVVMIDKKGLSKVRGKPVKALVSVGIVRDLGS